MLIARTKISSLVGKPFKDNGRGPDAYDCWGLVMEAFRIYGMKLPDFAISCFDTGKISGAIEANRVNWIKIEKAREPCLAVMRNDPKNPVLCSHCGVYVGEGKILHTLKKTGAVLTPVDHPYWGRKIEGYYKYAYHQWAGPESQ